tara:strand:- start:183 stop:4589 length:4407 start_codon:yes stop_codon:yes gene_type:complete
VANSITFKVKVEKDGNLKVVAKEAGAAARSTENLSKSTDKATKSRNRFHKAEKGVGQAGLSSAKGFSKMNQTMGGSSGLVAAYATLAANIFALTAAFGALSRAAQVEKLKEGMIAMGQSTGVAMNALSKNLVTATGNAISLEEAMRTTAQVTSAGFDPAVIERLGSVAKMASQALGRDLADSMQRLTRGAIKMEPELLDELGIMVRLDDATNEYATALGKSASDLTKFEKQQAFMNAVLEEGEKKFSALGDVEVNSYAVLAATFADLTEKLLNIINKGLEPMIKILGGSGTILFGALITFAATAGKMVQPALNALTAKLGQASLKSAQAAVDMVKLTGATGKGSKKVMELKKELAAGNVNTEKWSSGLNGAVKSVAGYERALQKNRKTTGNHSQATIQSERALRAAKKEHYSLIKAKLALDISNIKNSQTNALNTLQTHGLRAGIKALGLEMKALVVTSFVGSAGLTTMGRAMAVLRGVTASLSVGFAFLGTAIMGALNIIGLLVTAGYMLYEAFKWIMASRESDADNALSAAAETANIALDDLKTNALEVDNALDGQDTKIQGVTGRYVALSNILSTTNAEYNKLAAAQKKVDEENKTDRDAAGSGGKQLKFAQDLIMGSKAMQTAFKTANSSELLGALKDGSISANELDAAMAKLNTSNKQTNTAFVGFASAVEGLNTPLDEFFNKIKDTSTVDEIVSAIDDLQTGGANVKEFASGMDRIAAFSEKATDSQLKMLGITKKQLDDAKKEEGAAKTLLKTIDARLKTSSELFKNEKSRQITSKNTVKTLKQELALVKQRVGIEGIAAETYRIKSGLEKETEADLMAQIAMQEQLLKQNVDDKDMTAKKLSLEAELAHFRKTMLKEEDKALMIAKEQVTILKRKQDARKAELDIVEQIAKANSKLLDLEKQANDRAIKQANRADPNRGYSSAMNADDQLKSAIGTKKVMDKINEDGSITKSEELDLVGRRKLAADNEYNLAILRINMEATMNSAKLAVLDAEMRVIHKRRESFLEEQAAKDPSKTFTATKYESTQISKDLKSAMSLSGKDGPAAVLQRTVAEATRQGVKDGIDEGIKQGEEDRSGEILGAKGSTTAEVITNQNAAGGLDSLKHASQKIKGMSNALAPMMEQFRQLGPEGELMASVSQGALDISHSFTLATEKIAAAGDGASASAEKTVAVLQVMSTALNVIGDIMAKQSQARIAGIDREIEAEKKRDGKSKESVAKIAALEKKKDAAKRKAFEQNKKVQMAMVAINVAASIAANIAAASSAAAMAGMAAPGVFAGVLGMLNAVTLGLGAIQIGMIAGTSYQGGGSINSGGGGTPSSISVGSRGSSSDLGKSQSARGELAYFRGDQGTGGAENFRPAFYGKKNRAMGGNTGYVVGEQGPELFMPDRPGTIVPADDTAAVGGNTNVTFSINAIDASGVEDVLAEQQGNIIGMIRTAANSYGEEFLEDLDETTYTSPVARRA